MLKNEINVLRKKLDDSILNDEDYSVIYKLSTDLDKLIAQYYKIQVAKGEIYEEIINILSKFEKILKYLQNFTKIKLK